MTYGIGSILLALLLVLMLSLASYGKNDRRRANSAGFQYITAQVDTLKSIPLEETAYQVLVFHPASRTDFGDFEKSIKGIGDSGKIDTKLAYYTWGKPETTKLAGSMKIRTSPQSTIVVFKAPNGAITWGGPEEMVSSVQASAVFPSDGMCEIIKSAQGGNDVLLVFSHDGAPNGQKLVQTASAYAQEPTNKAELYVIDPYDPTNLDIVERTKLPPDSLKDARMLFMVNGRVLGQLGGPITGQDIQALKKSCSGKAGCC